MSNSVALVVLDSVRKDYFDEHFDWLDGVWFDHAWSTGNYSIPAHGSLFGGKYPSELGVHAKSQRLDCPEPVLAETLREEGYRTRAYSANALVGPDLNFDRGFSEYNIRWDLSETFPHLFPWREELLSDADSVLRYPRALARCVVSDASTVASIRRALEVYSYDDDGAKEALEFVRTAEFDDEEFLFMNLMEGHWPYWGSGDFHTYDANPVDEAPQTIPGGDVDLSAQERGYEDCVRYLSRVYREIHDELLDSFDFVVTLSDHGDLFGEHGAKAHYYGLFEELTRIPVVVSDGTGRDQRRDDVISLVDVHATVCGIAGVDPDGRGTDLLSETQADPRLLEFHGFRADRIDSLEQSGFAPAEIERYDQYLSGIAMPEGYYGHETIDGFEERGDPVGDPREQLDALLESLDVREPSTAEQESLSERTERRLEDLGYLG